jgi:hypothetical protein
VETLENRYLVAQERYKDFVAECAEDRLKASQRVERPSLFQYLARLCGHQLLRLSFVLLRYGKAEAQSLAVSYQVPMKSADAN